MAGKKLPKDVDFAAGFFSHSVSKKETFTDDVTPKITAPEAAVETQYQKEKKTKHQALGGRPKKNGLKNEQFTLTMHPELYEKLRIIAYKYTGGNFSRLIDEAIGVFCREQNINLAEIAVDPQILDAYKQKQTRKTKK